MNGLRLMNTALSYGVLWGLLEWLLIWFALAGVTVVLAHRKNRNDLLWAFLGLAFPIFSLICISLLSPLPASGPNAAMRKCPLCAEWVKNEALICRYCGNELPPTLRIPE